MTRAAVDKSVFMVQAEVTPIVHRCVAFRSSATLRLSFLARATVEGENTIQRQGCKQHQQGQRIVVWSSLLR
jgi:hypothetical protein